MSSKRQSSGHSLLLLILVAVGIAGVVYFIWQYFQVRHVVISGNAMYTSPYVEALADVPEGTHMLRIDRDAITSNIESVEPYLQVVSIDAALPDTVHITVEERHPEALLSYGNEYLLIDKDSVVLEALADRTSSDRPEVAGIVVSRMEVGEPIETSDSFKVSVLQEILTELDTRNVYPLVATIDLSNINNILMYSPSGLQIRFGQAEKIADKVKWISNRLPALERDGQSNGVLDVSAGSFATYSMFDDTGGSGIVTPPGGSEPTAEQTQDPSAEPTNYPDGESGQSTSNPDGESGQSTSNPDGESGQSTSNPDNE